MAKGSGITAYFSPSEVLYRAGRKSVRIEFAGANYSIPEGTGEMPGRANFFRGQPEEWVTGVSLFQGVVYRNLYPGIDLRYGAEGRNLKSEFAVAPGSDPSVILIRYIDTYNLRIGQKGDLLIPLNGQDLREEVPSVYQDYGGQRVTVEGRFVFAGAGTVRLEIGPYDRSLPLIVDPSLSYSTLLDGSSPSAATALAVDANGSAYVTGFTSAYNFPTASPEQNVNAGGNEVFVAKLNVAGTGLVYCTYIGGSGDDRGYGIAVDSTGSAYITGSTTSRNFPTRYPIQAAMLGGKNAFVLKLSPSGSALVFSTYLGGSGSDAGNGIALDLSANAYIVGDTTSLNFPASGLQKGNKGGQDAFVASINSSGTSLMYSTYLGGSGTDHGAAIAVDSSGGAYVTGSTFSTDFPLANAFQKTIGGGQDAFVARLAPGGSALTFSTYLGGSGGTVGNPEAGQGIALDSQGSVYVAGVTPSANFPVLSALQPSLDAGLDAFVTKLSSTGILLYSTYFGGSGIDEANAIAVDTNNRAFVVGYTASTDLPIVGGFQSSNGGDYDAFIAELSATGNSLVWSSYLGGSSSDTATAVALDPTGNLYVAGWTLSTDFPLVNPYQSVNTDNYAAFVTKIVFPTSGPAVLGVAPSSGTGLAQTFSLQFSDVSGAADITGVAILINTSTAVAGACSVTYVPSQNVLALLTDAGTAPGASITPGSGSQQNSQCTLNGAGSSVTLAGTTLTLNLSLTFQSAFAGSKIVYLQAANPAGSTGWLAKGSWTVQAVTVTAVSVSPSSGSGSSQAFAFQFSDAAGAADITAVAVSFNSNSSTVGACTVSYVRAQNTLALLTDSGAAPGTTIVPGGGTEQNSQCTLNGAGSSVSTSGNLLTLTLSLTFQAAFQGAKNIYMQATNPSGTTAWQSEGTWTVQFGASAVSVSPASGSGSSQTFAFQFSDTGGATDLTSVSVLFNTSASTASACSVIYVRAQNTLSLLTDAGATPGTTITPGSGTQQNSQCTLNGAGSSVSPSGNVLTLNLALTFQAAFHGAKTVYMQAVNPSGTTGWQLKGAWTVQFGAVSAVSVSPASGSGSSQTFVFQFSDTSGAADLTSVSDLFNTSASTVSACSVTYVRAQNALSLLTDAGATPGTTITPGSGTQQNSQCTLNGAGSSVSTSGNLLALSLSLTFQPAFQGAKNIYMQAANSGGSTAWQSEGTWTVQPASASAVAVNPSSGSGLSQSFAFQFSDTGGAADLTSVGVLFNSSLSTAGACAVIYNQSQNSLSLLTDAGTSPGTTIGPGSGTQQNSQCILSGAGSSVATVGNLLTLTLALTFQAAFQGSKTVYMQAANSAGTSAWQAEGSWTVPVGAVGAASVSPSSGSGSTGTFSFQFSDTAGATDLTSVSVLFNSSTSSVGACAAAYIPAQNSLVLLTDAGASPGTTLTLGSGSQQNSQCILYSSGSSAFTSGNVLTLNLAITFQTAFTGAKNIYMKAANSSGGTSWQAGGTWSILPAVVLPPGLVSYWGAEGTPNDGVSGYNGTLENGAAYAPGKIGQAFSLNGTNSFVHVSGTGTISGPRTYSAWVYPHASATGLPVLEAGAVGVGDFLTIRGSTLFVDHWGYPSYVSSLVVTPESWNHIAMTYDGSTIQFYVNAVAASPISGTLYNYGVSTLNIGGNQIGGSTAGPSFNGLIDEVQWYSRALTASEIGSIYGGASMGTGVPAAVSVSPASGSGPSQTFSFQFFDPGGATNLVSTAVLFNASASVVGACSVTYVRAQNTLVLLTDSGASPGTTITPGSGTQQNSQCILNGAGSSVSVSGNVLILNLSLAFQAGLSGAKTIYMQAVNPSGSTGWQSKGSWTVQFTASVVSVAPASGSGYSQTFGFQFSDTGGAADLTSASILFNTSASTTAACSVTYIRAQNSLALMTDAGTAPATNITPGSGTQQNSQCSLNGVLSSVSTSGNVLTMNLALTFQMAFSGAKTVYLQVANPSASTGWQSKGSWTVQFGIASVVSVSPVSGSGSSQTFVSQFSDTLGASELSNVSVLISTSTSVVNACSVTYVQAQNSLALLTDSGAAPGTTITPGSGTQQNSQCTLSGSGSSVSTSGNVLTLNLSVTFLAASGGAKTVYLSAANPAGSTGWLAKGAWTVQFGASPVSVSPGSGSGLVQTFGFQFSDTGGAADLTSASVLFNTSASTTAACSVTYIRAQNSLALMTDAGTAPVTTITPGSGTQQNSQCTLNGSGSSVSASGNLLTLNFAITFKNAFLGPKKIYMQATNPYGTTAWQAEGTWTVQAIVFPANLVSYWSAEGTAIDSVSGYNGALVNGATYAPGKVGQAFSLNGTNSFVQVSGTGMIGGPRTYSAWVYPHASATGLPVLEAGAAGSADFLTIRGSTLFVDHWGYPEYVSSLAVTPESWNHIALIYDGSTIQFYVNGVAASPISGSLYDYSVSTLNIGGNQIGGSTTGPSFNGLIDEVQWYSRALTASEVLLLSSQ